MKSKDKREGKEDKRIENECAFLPVESIWPGVCVGPSISILVTSVIPLLATENHEPFSISGFFCVDVEKDFDYEGR